MRRAGSLGLTLAVVAGCSGRPPPAVEPGPQGYYRTGYPIHDAAPALERVFASVKQIHVTVAYDSYLFAEESAPRVPDLGEAVVRARAGAPVVRSHVATAVAIASRGGQVTFLTADHAVHRPDTIYEYFGTRAPGARHADARVRNLLVKRHQTNLVIDGRRVSAFEILARDERVDLALIGVRGLDGELPRIRPLDARSGNAGRLSMGSFVYVLGYPAGYPMVTRGIVSVLPDGGPGGFVVDGLWNEGMSGGLILGVRGQGGELEWLGMVRAAAAGAEQRLVAPEGAIDVQDPGTPYEGPIFLEEGLRVRYGIMLPVPITEIRRFVDRHRPELWRAGYDAYRF